MKTLTTNIARFVMVSALLAGMTVQAEQTEQTTQQTVVVEVKTVSTTALTTIQSQFLQDLQQQLTDSIAEQANSALSHVVKSVKAMLP